jgi:hypothetical protein
LLDVFTAEAQRTPSGGIFCLSGDDDKQKDSSEREEAGMHPPSRKVALRKNGNKVAKNFTPHFSQ